MELDCKIYKILCDTSKESIIIFEKEKNNQIRYVNKSFINKFYKKKNHLINKDFSTYFPVLYRLIKNNSNSYFFEDELINIDITNTDKLTILKFIHSNPETDLSNLELLKNVLKSSSEAIRIVDTNNNIIYANQAYVELNETSIDRIIGSKCDTYLCSQNYNSKNSSLDVQKSNKILKDIEIRVNLNNKVRHFYFSISPVIKSNNEFIGVIESFRDISAFKEKDNDYLNLIFNSINEGIWDFKRGGDDLLSEKVFSLLNCKKNELNNDWLKLIHSNIHKDDFAFFQNEWKKLDSKIDSFSVAIRLKVNSKIYEWFSVSGNVIERKRGKLQRIIGSISNIQNNKDAEKALIKSERQFKQFTYCSADWVWEVDAESRYTFCSGKIKEILGYEPEELIGKTPFDFMPTEEAKNIKKIFKKVVETNGEITDLENWNITKNGELVCLLTNGVPIYDDSGKHIGYRGLDRDITAKKESEKIIKEREEQIRIIFENSKVSMVLANKEGFIYAYNKAFKELVGYEHEELKTKHFSDLTFPDDLKKELFLFDDLVQGEIDQYQIEKRLIIKNDRLCWVKLSISVYRNEKNEIEYFVGVLEDISQKKIVEEALKNSEEKYRKLFNNSNVGILIADAEGQILDLNPAFSNLIGYENKEIVNRNFTEFTYPVDLKREMSLFNKIKRGDILNYNLEKRYVTKNNDLIWGRINVSSIRQNNNNIQYLIAIVEDFSDRKNYERELQELFKERKIILDTANIGIAYLKDRKFVWHSRYLETMFGYSSIEISGQTTEMFYPDEESFLQLGKEAYPLLTRGKSYETERLMKRRDNELFWCKIKGKAINPKNINQGSIWLLDNIDKRKRAEEALKESEETLQQVFEISPAAIRVVDDNSKIVKANSVYSEYNGKEIEEIIGAECNDFLCSNVCKIQCGYKLLKAGKDNLDGEIKVYNAKGEEKFLSFKVKALKDENNVTSGMVQMFWDISKIKRTQNALKESESKYRALFEQAQDGIKISDIKTGKIVDCNYSFANLLDLEKSEIIGMNQKDIFVKDEYEIYKKHFHGKDKLNSSMSLELKVKTKHGIVKDVAIKGNTLLINKNQYFQGIYRDISRRKQYELQLEKYKKHLEKLVEERTSDLTFTSKKLNLIYNTIEDAILITNYDGEILESNEKAYELLVGNNSLKNLRKFLDDNEKTTNYFRQVIDNEYFVIEFVLNNSQSYYEISGTKIDFFEQPAILHIIRNINDRKTMQRKMLKAIFETEEKERKRFAKDLHDGLGALLSGIKLHISILDSDKIETIEKNNIIEKTKVLLSEATEATRSIAQNIKPQEIADFGLFSAVNSLAKKLANENLNINVKAPGISINIDKDNELIIYRVISELINNSIKHANASIIDLHLNIEDHNLSISFTDNGKGFEIREVELKDEGMGINNIKSRIETIGGKVNFISEKGKGILVKIIIPIQ